MPSRSDLRQCSCDNPDHVVKKSVSANPDGNLLSAIRSINDPAIQVGETVDVFIYRLFVIDGNTVTLAHNQSLARESVVI